MFLVDYLAEDRKYELQGTNWLSNRGAEFISIKHSEIHTFSVVGILLFIDTPQNTLGI